jgi:hypothetical protein
VINETDIREALLTVSDVIEKWEIYTKTVENLEILTHLKLLILKLVHLF